MSVGFNTAEASRERLACSRPSVKTHVRTDVLTRVVGLIPSAVPVPVPVTVTTYMVLLIGQVRPELLRVVGRHRSGLVLRAVRGERTVTEKVTPILQWPYLTVAGS